MILDFIIYGVVSGLTSLASYYLTENLIFTFSTLAAFILYFIIYEFVIRKVEREKWHHFKDLTSFIHDFLVSFSVNEDKDQAFENAKLNVSNSLIEECKTLEEYPVDDKLDHLKTYFNSSLYQLFLKTIFLCSFYRADVIKISSFINEENNLLIISSKDNSRKVYRSLFEFLLLWVIAFAVLIILRFAINNYFNVIKEQYFYLIGIGIFFTFFLFSIHLFNYSINRSKKYYEQ